MPPGPAYTSTVNPRPTVFSLGEHGLEVNQRKGLRLRRGMIRYDDIQPEYSVTRVDDHHHEQGMLVIIAVSIGATLAMAGRIYRWSWIAHAGPAHWSTAACVGTLGVLLGLWLIIRHRGPQIRYHFFGKHPFVIGGKPETKDDLDIFVNLLQQRIWAG